MAFSAGGDDDRRSPEHPALHCAKFAAASVGEQRIEFALALVEELNDPRPCLCETSSNAALAFV